LATLATSLKYFNGTADASFTNPKVALNKNMMTITHATSAITSAASVKKIKFAADLLKDVIGNPNLAVEDSPEADGAGPIATGYTLSNSGKDVTITFDEDIYWAAAKIPVGTFLITIGTTTKPMADKSLSTATTSVTIVDGNQLKFSNLNVALAAGNKIMVKAGTLSDQVFNKNLVVEVTIVP